MMEHVDRAHPFQRELLPEEHVMWHGKPNPDKHFSKSDIIMIPFSLLWGGFALYWNISVWMINAPLFFKLFGIPFLFAGLYIIFGRFIHKAYIKKRTHYALTNKRLLIKDGRGSITTQNIKSIQGERMTVDNDGVGTITFGVMPQSWNVFTMNRNIVPTFQDINGCRNVYAKYQAAKSLALADLPSQKI